MSDYHQLGQVEDDSAFEKHEKHDSSPKQGFLQRHLSKTLLVNLNILIFGIYAVSISYLLNREPSDRACDYKLSTYSPALPIITYKNPKHFDAEIVQKNKYRGKPSPEIDAAWLEIGLGTPAIRLYDDDLTRLNKSDKPDRPLHRIPEEFGGGYLAMLEVFHLLHCLNSLRKAMDKDYYAEERAKHGGENANRAHDGKPSASEAKKMANGGLEHCIDMLRVYIKCKSDVTPITFFDNVLLPSRKLPMPDFNTLHSCRNFNEIWKWNGNNERTLQWDEIGLQLGDLMHVD